MTTRVECLVASAEEALRQGAMHMTVEWFKTDIVEAGKLPLFLQELKALKRNGQLEMAEKKVLFKIYYKMTAMLQKPVKMQMEKPMQTQKPMQIPKQVVQQQKFLPKMKNQKYLLKIMTTDIRTTPTWKGYLMIGMKKERQK